MEKTSKFLLISLFLVGIVLSYFVLNIVTAKTLSSQNPPEEKASLEYSHTVAICNGQSQCVDYQVKCKNSEVLSITPLTGLAQFSDSWEDPREESELCNIN